MKRIASDEAIRAVAAELLARQRRVTVRGLSSALRRRFGGAGRMDRVSAILRALEQGPPPSCASPLTDGLEAQRLREELRQAMERAERSEQRERAHQDYWAARYAEQVQALERHRASLVSSGSVSHDQFLAAHRRIAELTRRLARYENPEEPAAEDSE